MIITILDAVRALMVEAEAHQHAAGWDSHPPTLYAVAPGDDGMPTIFPVRLGVFTEMTAPQEMRAIAYALREYPEYWRENLPIAPIAFLYVGEAWAHHGAYAEETPEQFRERRGDRSLADMPGSVESRMAIGVMGKKYLLLQRIRGSEPEWFDGDLLDGDEGGALRLLIDISRAAGEVWT